MGRGWIGLMALLLLGAATGQGVAEETKTLAPDGAAVIAYLTRAVDYHDWPLWPSKGELYQGQHPHGAFLTTYVTPEAAKAILARVGKLPDGAMVVKENYSASKQLAAITVMYRVKGYNPDGGDWFYLKYAPDGRIDQEGKVPGCIGCHAAVKGNDWLFTGPVKP